MFFVTWHPEARSKYCNVKRMMSLVLSAISVEGKENTVNPTFYTVKIFINTLSRHFNIRCLKSWRCFLHDFWIFFILNIGQTSWKIKILINVSIIIQVSNNLSMPKSQIKANLFQSNKMAQLTGKVNPVLINGHFNY